jgi:hypothetical protein
MRRRLAQDSFLTVRGSVVNNEDRRMPLRRGELRERARDAVEAQHELQAELLADAAERVDRVRLHAHADNHDAGASRGARHDLVDHAGHADALEDDRRFAPPCRRDRRARFDALVRAERDGQLPPPQREVGGDDRADPAQPQGRDHREAHRPATNHQRLVARLQARLVHRVEADGHRLGQRGLLGREPVRDLEQQRLGEPHVLGVAARLVVRVADGLAPLGALKHRYRAHARAGRETPRRPRAVVDDLRADLVAHDDVAGKIGDPRPVGPPVVLEEPVQPPSP